MSQWGKRRVLGGAAEAFNRHLDAHIQQTFVNERVDYPLYHYTSIEGLFGILREGHLRLMRIEDLDDEEEFRWPLAIAQEEINRYRSKSDQIFDFFFDRFVEGIGRALEGNFGLYSASFCQSDESVHHWKEFGRAGTGACVAFSPHAFTHHANEDLLSRAFIYPMRYDESEAEVYQHAAIAKASLMLSRSSVRKILLDGKQDGSFLKQIATDLAIWLVYNATKFKRQRYKPESEVRLLLLNDVKALRDLEMALPSGRLFVPYSFAAPIRAQDEIVNIRVGYYAPEDVEQRISELLGELGHPALTVRRSNIIV